jgi:chromosome partitioning protein
MSKVVTLVSNNVGSGKTTFAFNLGYALKRLNKKVLLVCLQYSPAYLELLKNPQLKLDNRNCISPFNIAEYDKKFQLLFLSDGKTTIGKGDYSKLLTKQIQIFKKYFDVIIFDTSPVWTSLLDKALELSDEIIPIYNVNNFAPSNLSKVLNTICKTKEVNKNLNLKTIVLNGYDSKNHSHINVMLQINKSISKNYSLVCLPFNDNLVSINTNSIQYVKKNQ